MTWSDYHIEALSGPSEEIDRNMVDKDRTISKKEKMNTCALGNIRLEKTHCIFLCR